MSGLAQLLTDCEVNGILLFAADDGSLTIDAPQEALTTDLLDRLKTQKAVLLAFLRLVRAPRPARPEPHPATAGEPTASVCRCGTTAWRDVPIHGGKSVRRDCACCGRFLDFPAWYGKATFPLDTAANGRSKFKPRQN